MGATSGRNYIYIFFSRSVRVSSPSEAIEHRALGKDVISEKRFRLLQHISNARHSMKFRSVEEKNHVQEMFSSALMEANL